jgi:hypothetical protein
MEDDGARLYIKRAPTSSKKILLGRINRMLAKDVGVANIPLFMVKPA